MTTAAARSEVVEALSARAELLLVVRASMALVACVWMYLAFAAGAVGTGPTKKNLLPFQVVIAERPGDEQRIFRELQEGLAEAESSRGTNGTWPAVAQLRDDGVPPFAIDPTQKLAYAWSLIQSGSMINYLGLPKSPGGPAWLVLIQEPVPGVPPDQAFEDEEHHRLSSGQMLHVSTWTHTSTPPVAERIVRMPQAEGWTQLYAVGPSNPALATPVAP